MAGASVALMAAVNGTQGKIGRARILSAKTTGTDGPGLGVIEPLVGLMREAYGRISSHWAKQNDCFSPRLPRLCQRADFACGRLWSGEQA